MLIQSNIVRGKTSRITKNILVSNLHFILSFPVLSHHSELSCVIPLDIDAQIDFMTDFASTHHREYDFGRVQFYKRPIKVKFQGQSQNERFFCNIRRTKHILYTLKEGKTIIVMNYVCSANYMKIDRELKELWPLVICLKMMIL